MLPGLRQAQSPPSLSGRLALPEVTVGTFSLPLGRFPPVMVRLLSGLLAIPVQLGGTFQLLHVYDYPNAVIESICYAEAATA